MNAIIPHSFEDNLVRSVMKDNEPWFIGNDVCKALAIKNSRDAIDRLDDDEKGVANADTLGGMQMLTIVSEPGVFRLIFTSRKPEAERFKRWLAHDVLPKLRRNGEYTTGQLRDAEGNAISFGPVDPRSMDAVARMRCVDLVSRLYGMDYAQQLYRDIGLPRVVMAAPGGLEDAKACLDRILTAEGHGHALLDLLERAMDQANEALEPLRMNGILTRPADDGFIIANRSAAIGKILDKTKWRNNGWGHVLRRLPGAQATQAHRFDHGETSRGTFLPMSVLDLLE